MLSKPITTLVIIFFSALSVIAQQATIVGRITDGVTGDPIEFATVSIYNQDNDELIGGGTSEFGGSFDIETKKCDSYAVIEFLSYQSKKVQLSFSSKILDLGNIILDQDALVIEGIEVVGEKSTSQFLLDKKVFNVSSDLATRGGTAQDVLDNVPSISVDIEGNIALRGSNNVRILINGKPSGLLGISGNGGLQNLQASQIERVEVITNPSARYDAEGTAGIINIVLKKDNSNGFSGSFQLSTGLPFQLGGGANLNYRKNNINFFVNYAINKRNSPGSGKSYTEFYNGDSTLVTDLTRKMDRDGLNQSVRTGFDIYLPNKQTLTAALTYANEDNNNVTSIFYRDRIFVNSPISRSLVSSLPDYELRTDQEKELEDKLEYSLEYNKEFDDKEHKLSASFQYQNNGEEESSELDNVFYIEGMPSDKLLDQRSSNSEREKRYVLQMDYVRPLTKSSKFEFGGRSSIRDISNKYKVETLEGEVWVNEAGLSNNFDYDEGVHALYTIFSDKIGSWSYQLGLRSEYSDIRTLLVDTQEGYDSTYINLFPSGFLSYALTETEQVQISYSRRINRPGFWSLNPFFTISDNRNFFSGNPFLRPEYTDSYELGFLKYWDQANFNSSIYYRRTTDNISRIKTVNPDGTSFTLPQNLGINDEIGIEFLLGVNPYKWLKLDGEVNLFNSSIHGTGLPDDLRVNTFAYTGRLNARISFNDGTDLQIRSNYRSPRDILQGRRKAVTSIDLGVSRDFLNKNLTATISVRDLLNQRKWIYERFADEFYEDGEFQWRRNSITFSLNYRINAKKERPGRGNGGNYDGGEY